MKLKKIISAAVGVATLCASLSFSSTTIDFVKDNIIVANAEDEMPSSGKCGDNVYYSLSNDGVLTISGTGKMYDYNLPGTMIINEKRTDSPFYGNNNIVSIVMEKGATTVGESAFAFCRSIEKVSLGSGLESIGDEAFYNCSGINEWGLGCTDIKRVGYHAFDGTSFLYHSDGEPVTLYGVLIDATDCNNGFEIPDGIISIGDGAFNGREDLINIEIPSTIEYIGDAAFGGCTNLKEVKLPETIDEISDSLFCGCENLEKVNIPESVKSIGDSDFGGCDNLKEITIPKAVDYIGSYAFSCKNLEKIEILTQTQNIHSWTFAGTKWESNKLDENPALVVNGVLLALSSDDDNYVIPDNVEKISEMCFFETEMNSIVIPNSVKKIATEAFQSSAVDHLIIPDSVTDIERYGLRNFYGRNITLSNQLTTIKEGTFYVDTELENIYIPKSITSIEEDAFGMCKNLKDVYYSGTEEEWNNIKISHAYDKTTDENGDTYVGDNDYLLNANIHFNSDGIPAKKLEKPAEIAVGMLTITQEYSGECAGKTFEVPVAILGNPGFANTDITFTFDERIEFLGIDGNLINSPEYELSKNVVNVKSANSNNITNNDVIYTLKFKLSETAKVGDYFYISANLNSINNADGEDVNAKMYDGYIEIVEGSKQTDVTTTSTTKKTTTTTTTTTSTKSLGDINGDSKIDSKDAVLVLKSYAESLVSGKKSTDLTGDINNDGSVDSKDAVIILKYYAATLTGFEGSISEFNK